MAEGETEQVTGDVVRLMSGQAVPVTTIDVQGQGAAPFVPRTKATMGYVVMTVVFNNKGQVLMVQEAKPSIRGTWYLPAGRLEPGENFVDGAKREVTEEAGVDCDISSVFSLHYPMGHWMRLAFYGVVTGGQLKTLDQQDEESLQAAFYDVDTILKKRIQLRKEDVIPVIQMALEYRASLASVPLHPPLLPVIACHNRMIHRVVLVAEQGDADRLHMLAGTSGTPHLPNAAVCRSDVTLITTLQALIKEALDPQTSFPKTRFHGVLGVEHCGTGQATDGMCITTLVSLHLSEGQGLPTVQNGSYAWTAITNDTCSAFLRKAVKGYIVKIV